MRAWKLLIAAVLLPAPAFADIFTVWAAGRGAYLNGTGDVFDKFDSRFGGGVEGGVELLGIDLWGEGLILGTDQYFFTANLGFDAAFGDDTRVVLGLFTGPVVFKFPEDESAGSELDVSKLPTSVQTEINSQVPGGVNTVKASISQYQDDEKQASGWAFGWNVARARLDVEQKLAPVIYVGLGAEAGYHYILTGEEAAADSKNVALRNAARKYHLDPEVTDQLRKALGAHDTDLDSLDGVNYQVGLYLKFEL